MTQYSKDGIFMDPVVRCDSCHKLLLVEKLKETGRCPACGTRKVRNVFSYTPEEREQMVAWAVDNDFLKLFEPVEDTGVARG